MKLVELSLNDFLKAVDSPTPAPGGGSVSALAISQGISLLRMVSHLSVSKKKFLALEEDVKNDYLKRTSDLEELKNKVFELIDADTEAFNKIMEAFKLPKATEEEIQVRNQAIEKATLEATRVPYETANVAKNALEIALPMFQNANKSATSDFGVGILMIYAGLSGAILNVKTNMVGFSNRIIAESYFELINNMDMEAKAIVNKLMTDVNGILK